MEQSLPPTVELTENVVGITSTLPIEVLLAAGRTPVDMNNLFITNKPAKLVDDAEKAGLPTGACSWIKGLYSAALKYPVSDVIGVTGGDCTNTRALLELLQAKGIKTFEFSYPYPADKKKIREEIKGFCARFGTTMRDAEIVREQLRGVRQKLRELDRLAWQGNLLTGAELHSWLVSGSDFCGSVTLFERRLEEFLTLAKGRSPLPDAIRLGYLGVPPIVSDLFQFIEKLGGRVCFCEFARQFAMPYKTESLLEQYLHYTYPYATAGRVSDIQAEVRRRNIKGLIHYTQSFCWRQLTDSLIRAGTTVPVLTIEADKPQKVSGQLSTRIESFLEILADR